MLHNNIGSLVFLAALTLCGQHPAQAQKQTAADSHAREILTQARAALGGEVALNDIHSLSATGDFIIGVGEHRASGQLKLDWLLPTLFMRSMKWSPIEGVQVTTTEGIVGAKVWTVSKSSRASPDEKTAPELREDADTPEFQAQMRADLNCLLITLFLGGKDFPPDAFVYTGETAIENIKADCLQIKAGDGITYTLAIDQTTHRPLMIGYRAARSARTAPMHRKVGDLDSQTSAPGPELVNIEIYFSDYRPIQEKRVGQVWLPHQINKSSDGNPVENFRIESFKLNPPLKAEQFEKNRQSSDGASVIDRVFTKHAKSGPRSSRRDSLQAS